MTTNDPLSLLSRLLAAATDMLLLVAGVHGLTDSVSGPTYRSSFMVMMFAVRETFVCE